MSPRELVPADVGAITYHPDGSETHSLVPADSAVDVGDDRDDVDPADLADAENCESILREHWGDSYDQRVALNLQVLEEEGLLDLIAARLPDGSLLGNNPQFSAALNWLFLLALRNVESGEGGHHQFTGGAGGASGRLAEIRKIMATDWARYRSEGLDKEYERLLVASGATDPDYSGNMEG